MHSINNKNRTEKTSETLKMTFRPELQTDPSPHPLPQGICRNMKRGAPVRLRFTEDKTDTVRARERE